MRSMLFVPWVPPGALVTLCALSRIGVSASPSSVEFLQSNPAGFQILWGLLLPVPDPQAWKYNMGLRNFPPVAELLWYNLFPVCVSPTWWIWDLILSQLPPSYYLFVASYFPLDVGYLFWLVPAFFVDFFQQLLWFWYLHKKGWTHILLLCHLELISSQFKSLIKCVQLCLE